MNGRLRFLFFLLPVVSLKMEAQEIGSNFNHIPESINFEYLDVAGVQWIRTTPYILDYRDENRDLKLDKGISNIKKAGELGYQVAFGYRWDFKKRKMRVPEPDSELEKQCFDWARRVLKEIAPHVDIFKLGNEPSFETLDIDEIPNENGVIPIVRFTERLLTEVVEPLYAAHAEWKRPRIYVGSIVWPYDEEERNTPATLVLLKMADENPAIEGLAIHLHVTAIEGIEESFVWVRSLMPEKPIIVPEFSLQRLYRSKMGEKIGFNEAGIHFAHKYKRNPDWKLHEYFTYANHELVSADEWKALLDSRPWYPKNYLKAYYTAFQKYGVVLATYPLYFAKNRVTYHETSATWFLNPILMENFLYPVEGKNYQFNPLCFEDFQDILEAGRGRN